MRLRPLGWELAFFLGVLGVVLVGLLANSTLLVSVGLIAAAVAAPVVIVSFLVRLVAGILDEEHRRSRRRHV